MRELPLSPPDPARGISAPLIEARGVRYGAGGKTLIHGLDLAIRPGRRTVILGPNGAGKSLTMRLLHGLIAPAAGQVLWRGAPMGAAGRQAQAMVFQRPVMLRRSVRANLRFALTVRGFRGAERARREAEALARARLEPLAHRPARVLSGGEQQRLAVARALACQPQALFLDEPTASLDPASTQAIEALILEAHRAGVTVILITHDLGQARRLGEDVVFLQDGRIAEAGPASRVLESPSAAPVRAWLEGRLYLGPGEGLP
ncbi:MAG: ATP-binding cassette domain-containing protein [Pseudomonadota bacterium]